MPRKITGLVILISLINLVVFVAEILTQVYPYGALVVQVISLFALGIALKPKINLPKKEMLLLLGLFLVAFGVRIYKVDTIPPGMLGDEVTIAKTSEAVLNSANYKPFSTENLGHPTMLLYVNGLFLKFFGRNLVALRLSSILFAALTIPIFYLLCRRFFSLEISVISALLVAFAYAHFIPSRYANEIAAAVFFQVLAMLYLIKSLKDKTFVSFFFLGLAIGLGLLTYLSFRTQALFMLIILTIGSYKIKVKPVFWVLTLLTIGLTTYPLISYSFNNPESVWARAKSISVFNQGLPGSEMAKEIVASTWKLKDIFIGKGDPDPRQNPAMTALYDPITVGLFLLGLIVLGRKFPKLLLFLVLLSIPTIINDIFTIEIIPEYHFYGESHPNIFHISSFMPLIYLGVAASLAWLQQRLNKMFPTAFLIGMIFLLIPILVINLNRYFSSPVTQFAYITKGVKELKIVNLINSDPSPHIYLSPSLLDDAHIQYFTYPKKLLKYTYQLSQSPFVFDPHDNVDIVQKLANSALPHQNNILNPWGYLEAISTTSQ